MIKPTITEVRRRFSELVKRANAGERIGITRRGKLFAILAPPQPEHSLREAFAEMEKIRQRSRLPKGVTIKSLIEEGRTWGVEFEIAQPRMSG